MTTNNSTWRHPISGRLFPVVCGARHPITREPILIEAGEPGYCHWRSIRTSLSPEEWNQRHKIDADTSALMVAMSMSYR
jgi:hypothetical protein